LRSLEESIEEFNARHIPIVCVSVDPPEITRQHAEKQGYTFAFLSDEKAEVIRAWDLLHPGAYQGEDIARPAEFLIDATGTVRWANLTESYKVRAKAQEILKVIDELGLAPAAAPPAK